jgi:hypothetical protein
MAATFELNTKQTKAVKCITKMLNSNVNHEVLLLGAAGSGKTTVIVNCFNNNPLKVIFCAFTNKATQVLKKIADKFVCKFEADFMTIHTMLRLESKISNLNFNDLEFKFNVKSIEYLKNYDVLIFDECSTISKKLYQYIIKTQEYILNTFQKQLKLIFLGDYWQLPPINEENSIVFLESKNKKWPVTKLDKVMRCQVSNLLYINNKLLSYIEKFKSNTVDNFVENYPYNLIANNNANYLDYNNFLESYIDTWNNVTNDVVILSFSKANCEKINYSIQNLLDNKLNRKIPECRKNIKFYKGDRCSLDRPVNLHKIIHYEEEQFNKLDLLGVDLEELPNVDLNLYTISNTELSTELSTESNKKTILLGNNLNTTLFNGDILDICNVEDVLVKTNLNNYKYLPKTFEAQLLTVKSNINNELIYQIVHIDNDILEKAKELIKINETRLQYLNSLSDFMTKFPKLEYGYCISIYKSQGSEWHTVYINMNSIKWSIVSDLNNVSFKKKIQLFKTTYTAISRASNKVICTSF